MLIPLKGPLNTLLFPELWRNAGLVGSSFARGLWQHAGFLGESLKKAMWRNVELVGSTALRIVESDYEYEDIMQTDNTHEKNINSQERLGNV